MIPNTATCITGSEYQFVAVFLTVCLDWPQLLLELALGCSDESVPSPAFASGGTDERRLALAKPLLNSDSGLVKGQLPALVEAPGESLVFSLTADGEDDEHWLANGNEDGQPSSFVRALIMGTIE